ncbi:MAG TPA: alginate export family protein [Gemmatimonadales bacterium]|nr:alginate export family protein [Gemmatimonadales bacterium]
MTRRSLGARGALVGLLVVLGAVSHPLRAQTPRPGVVSPFRPLRFDEDYGYLRDSLRHGWWQPLKYIPLGDWSSLTFGGEVRAQYERLDHPNFGALPTDLGGYALQRVLLHADWRIGSHVRAFGQLASALEEGRTPGPRPLDVDTLRLHQAFMELGTPIADGRLWTRVGRQELVFGGSRTFATRDPANVRRSFDAARAGFAGPRVAIDAFWGREVRVSPGLFDDLRDSTRYTWGFASTVTLRPQSVWLDAYLFRDHRDAARFAQGTAPTNRWTLGAVSRGRRGQWEWNVEGLYQWGQFAAAPINAYVGIWDVAYTFPARWQPRLALRGSQSSGDRDPTDPALQSLDPLYPRGFVLSGVPVGPINLTNIHPTLDLQLTRRVSAYVDLDVFWRTRNADGIYDAAGQLVRTAFSTPSHYIGLQPWGELDWFIGPYVHAEVAYAHFFPGAAVTASGPGLAMNYTLVSTTFTF